MTYKIPSWKELNRLASENPYTQKYDCVCGEFPIHGGYKYILIINSIGNIFDGEWVKAGKKWERPDGSVPPYARAKSFGILHP